jgi:hypothetical protein
MALPPEELPIFLKDHNQVKQLRWKMKKMALEAVQAIPT